MQCMQSLSKVSLAALTFHHGSEGAISKVPGTAMTTSTVYRSHVFGKYSDCPQEKAVLLSQGKIEKKH